MNSITILRNGQECTICFEDARDFHQGDCLVGLTLGFRLVEFALRKLAKFTLDEASVSFDTAFTGAGLKDALEVTLHAVSRGAFHEVDPNMIPQAPEGVHGRLWFAMTSGTSKIIMQVKPGVISDEFIRTARAINDRASDPALVHRLVELKTQTATYLAECDMNDILETIIVRVPYRPVLSQAEFKL